MYDIITQSEFLPTVTESKYVIIHFFHKDFERCKILGQHLNKIAPKYVPVLIRSIDSEKTPFFVGKLGITTLPTLVMFKDGVAIDRLVGFTDLGSIDTFTTEALEQVGLTKGIACSPIGSRVYWYIALYDLYYC